MSKVIMRIVGIVLIVVGIIGFAVKFNGLLNLTVTHDVVHLVTGAILLLAAQSQTATMVWARILGAVYLIVAVLGLFVQNVAGLIMLMPADTILHFILAIVLLYVGFTVKRNANVTQSA